MRIAKYVLRITLNKYFLKYQSKVIWNNCPTSDYCADLLNAFFQYSIVVLTLLVFQLVAVALWAVANDKVMFIFDIFWLAEILTYCERVMTSFSKSF